MNADCTDGSRRMVAKKSLHLCHPWRLSPADNDSFAAITQLGMRGARSHMRPMPPAALAFLKLRPRERCGCLPAGFDLQCAEDKEFLEFGFTAAQMIEQFHIGDLQFDVRFERIANQLLLARRLDRLCNDTTQPQ